MAELSIPGLHSHYVLSLDEATINDKLVSPGGRTHFGTLMKSTWENSPSYTYCEEFDGSDADTRLDNALSQVSRGERIYLERATYTDAHTIDQTAMTLISPDNSHGSKFEAKFTIDNADVILKGLRFQQSGELEVNGARCVTRDIYEVGNDIQINADDATCGGFILAGITFASGTSGDSVWGGTGMSVTDNGSNTVATGTSG